MSGIHCCTSKNGRSWIPADANLFPLIAHEDLWEQTKFFFRKQKTCLGSLELQQIANNILLSKTFDNQYIPGRTFLWKRRYFSGIVA